MDSHAVAPDEAKVASGPRKRNRPGGEVGGCWADRTGRRTVGSREPNRGTDGGTAGGGLMKRAMDGEVHGAAHTTVGL